MEQGPFSRTITLLLKYGRVSGNVTKYATGEAAVP